MFEYELLLKTPEDSDIGASEAADFDLDEFLGREISCRIELDGSGQFVVGLVGPAIDHVGAGVRWIHAFVSDAVMLGEEGRHIQYRLTLRPWLHAANHNADVKVFQNKTVVEILDELLADYPYSVEKRLLESYPIRDLITQYNETDFAFFERLCQQWGINYFFEHTNDRHRLVLIDNMGAHQKNPSQAYQEVEYHAPGWKTDAEYIHAFAAHHTLTSGSVAINDYEYTRSRADLLVSRSDPRPTGHANGEVYQWHPELGNSRYAQPKAGASVDGNDPFAEGRDFARLRMQALRTHGARAKASGNLRGMVPGCSFSLKNHPRQKSNAEYLVLDTRLVIEDVAEASQIKDAAAGRRQRWKIEVDFVAHPMAEVLRPAHTRVRPLTHGPEPAVVVGPPGENVWTDNYGRIKVQFLWDRIGKRDQHSSCWVRVGSQWAGNQLGAMHVPRIGQEVVIEFFSGDPDQPICTSKVFNQNNLPPWTLPSQAALSGFRSRELTRNGGNSAAGRSNHLVLDDTDRMIQVQLKSDHQSSSLSMGHITRIDGNAGRTEERGEGVELRTDGPLVARAHGMLLTTEARPNAVGAIKDMAETLSRLSAAREQHEGLSQSAQQAEAHIPGDQDEVTQAIAAQNAAIRGGPKTASGEGRFPELSEPHLVLASPAGIEASSAQSTHITSLEHNALTSGGHTSISTGKSLLVSAKRAIRFFSLDSVIKLVAARANIDIVALKNGLNLFALLDIKMQGDNILIQAKTKVTVAGRSSSVVVDDDITLRTLGRFVVHAAGHTLDGPAALNLNAVPLPTATYQGCSPAAKAAAAAQSGTVVLA